MVSFAPSVTAALMALYISSAAALPNPLAKPNASPAPYNPYNQPNGNRNSNANINRNTNINNNSNLNDSRNGRGGQIFGPPNDVAKQWEEQIIVPGPHAKRNRNYPYPYPGRGNNQNQNQNTNTNVNTNINNNQNLNRLRRPPGGSVGKRAIFSPTNDVAEQGEEQIIVPEPHAKARYRNYPYPYTYPIRGNNQNQNQNQNTNVNTNINNNQNLNRLRRPPGGSVEGAEVQQEEDGGESAVFRTYTYAPSARYFRASSQEGEEQNEAEEQGGAEQEGAENKQEGEQQNIDKRTLLRTVTYTPGQGYLRTYGAPAVGGLENNENGYFRTYNFPGRVGTYRAYVDPSEEWQEEAEGEQGTQNSVDISTPIPAPQ